MCGHTHNLKKNIGPGLINNTSKEQDGPHNIKAPNSPLYSLCFNPKRIFERSLKSVLYILFFSLSPFWQSAVLRSVHALFIQGLIVASGVFVCTRLIVDEPHFARCFLAGDQCCFGL